MSKRENSELTYAAIGRSAAAAGGAVAGVLLAVPLGAYLAVALFGDLGIPLMKEMVSEGTDGLSGIHAIVVGALVVFVAFVFAIYLVVALVAPMFVVVPLLATAAALRLVGAGAITRSLWLMLGIVGALAGTVLPATSVLNLDTHWWTWVLIVATGSFVSRLIVELWKPDLAGTPANVTAVWQRWRRLGVAWLILTMTAVAGTVILFLARVTMV